MIRMTISLFQSATAAPFRPARGAAADWAWRRSERVDLIRRCGFGMCCVGFVGFSVFSTAGFGGGGGGGADITTSACGASCTSGSTGAFVSFVGGGG